MTLSEPLSPQELQQSASIRYLTQDDIDGLLSSCGRRLHHLFLSSIWRPGGLLCCCRGVPSLWFCLPDGDQALSRAGPISRAPHLVADRMRGLGGSAGRSWSKTCCPPKAKTKAGKRAKRKKLKVWASMYHALTSPWLQLQVFTDQWGQRVYMHTNAQNHLAFHNTGMCIWSPVPTLVFYKGCNSQ